MSMSGEVGEGVEEDTDEDEGREVDNSVEEEVDEDGEEEVHKDTVIMMTMMKLTHAHK